MSHQAPTLTEAFKSILDSVLAGTHTSLPARVETYDAATQKVSAQPLLKRSRPDGTEVTYPLIPNIPVVWPRTANAIISLPLAKNDTVLLLFSERSMDEWLSQGGEVLPADKRRHDLKDAVALPGLYSFAAASNAHATDILIKHSSAEVSLTQDDVVIKNSASTITIATDGTVTIDTGGDTTVNSGGAVDVTASGNVTLNATTGKLAAGNSSAELLDLLDQTLTQIQAITTLTALGPQPIINLAAFTAIQANLALLKGAL